MPIYIHVEEVGCARPALSQTEVKGITLRPPSKSVLFRLQQFFVWGARGYSHCLYSGLLEDRSKQSEYLTAYYKLHWSRHRKFEFAGGAQCQDQVTFPARREGGGGGDENLARSSTATATHKTKHADEGW